VRRSSPSSTGLFKAICEVGKKRVDGETVKSDQENGGIYLLKRCCWFGVNAYNFISLNE